MYIRKLVFFCCSLIAFTISSANAQSEPRIRIVIPSVSEVEEKLKWMIELSPNPGLKKQWKTVKEDLIEAFTQGVDEQKPICTDIVFRKDELSFEMRIPISNLTDKKKGFLPNLEGMGFDQQKKLAETFDQQKKLIEAFYQFSEKNKKPYFLRYDKNYAGIAGDKQAVPANPPLATTDLQPILALKQDVVAELKNDSAGLSARRENFKAFRKQTEALIKRKRDENPDAFELRKLVLTQQLNESERFLVESEEIRAQWVTNVAAKNSRGEIALTALPDTDLFKSYAEFATKPSYFANVTLHDQPIAKGRLVLPFDEMRQAHLKSFYKAVRPITETEIKARKGTDAQKTATQKATNIFYDLLEKGADLGLIDGFIDAHPVETGKNVLICGVRAADGKSAEGIIKLIPEMQADWQVKLNAQEHGGVNIHEVTIPKGRLDSFQKLFAGESVFYVGTSENAVWGAAGFQCLDHQKTAIDQAAKPAPETVDPVVISYQVQVAKLEKVMDVIQKELGVTDSSKATKEQIKRQKEIDKNRKMADEAMGDCNSMVHGELKRTDNKIHGYLELNECVLKYVGSVFADRVKDLQ